MLPNRIALSNNATGKLRYMKQHTGVTPNILSRIALIKAIEAGGSLKNAGVADGEGQVLSRDVLFGDHVKAYEVILTQYMHDNDISLSLSELIPALIEVGIHKMGHVKKVQDLVSA